MCTVGVPPGTGLLLCYYYWKVIILWFINTRLNGLKEQHSSRCCHYGYCVRRITL